jgi:hypothetical protein
LNQPSLFDPPAPARTRVTLYHGDCLEVMPQLDAGSISMCFADLPYTATANGWDLNIPLDVFWPAVKRAAKAKCGFIFTATMRFATALICSNEKQFRHDLVWSKTRASGFANANKAPMRSHEHVLVFGSLITYNPQFTSGCPIKVTRAGDGVSTNWGIKPTNKGSTDKRYPLSVQNFKRDDMRNKKGHPTQKPVALLEWLIRTYTNEGDTVLDPTAGSGTTCIAAMRTGRHCIAIEKDPGYFEMMRKRVADERVRLGHT